MTDGPAHGTILLVEDEEGVRSVLSELLAGLGYTVLEAGNGVEAVRIATSHVGAIDLVVTDMVMPEMSGQELGRSLARLRPDLRIREAEVNPMMVMAQGEGVLAVDALILKSED